MGWSPLMASWLHDNYLSFGRATLAQRGLANQAVKQRRSLELATNVRIPGKEEGKEGKAYPLVQRGADRHGDGCMGAPDACREQRTDLLSTTMHVGFLAAMG